MATRIPKPNGLNGANGHHRREPEPESPISSSASDASSVSGILNGTSSMSINPRRNMNRKKSSPMMPAFMVSAPGKVIVFGEHAVVHGKVSVLWKGGKTGKGAWSNTLGS